MISSARRILMLLVLFLLANPARAELLRNDGWSPGASASFQAGFSPGEIAAARFTPTGPCPCAVTEVQLLFGGASGGQTVTLRIWDDSGLSTTPGLQLFSGSFPVSDSDDGLTSIDLPGAGVSVSGTFRVGVELSEAGLPSIAVDTDGSLTANRNFVLVNGIGWVNAGFLGLTGDWILRARAGFTGPAFSVGGNVSGLTGSLVLRVNDDEELTVNADGAFTFAELLPNGAAYDVAVVSAPSGQACAVFNGTGTIAGTSVNDIQVTCGDTDELRNDAWDPGEPAAFQGGFVAGEIAAARLTPVGPCPCELTDVRVLFGGAVGSRSVTLHIWNDDAGGVVPGPELFSSSYLLQASSTELAVIDLLGEGIIVNGSFRVGIEFSAAGLPAIARDSDGTITPGRNFIFDGGWTDAIGAGLTGDLILRATSLNSGAGYSVGGTVDGLAGTVVLQNNGAYDMAVSANGPFTFGTEVLDGSGYDVTVLSQPVGGVCTVANGTGLVSGADVTNVIVSCVQGELRNDTWSPGGSASFQAGFVPGEIAAARFTPLGPCPCDVANVGVLFGGAAGSQDVTLRIWDDATGTNAPGVELFSQVHTLTASNSALQIIDLSGEGIQVDGTFRVGIEFSEAGLPSIATDTDGSILADRNFLFTPGLGWRQSSDFGLTGDWILRVGMTGALGGFVWEDRNGDGIRGAAEPPLSFLPVYLLDVAEVVRGLTFTGIAGDYTFSAPANTALKLWFPTPTGYLITTPNRGSNDELDSDVNPVTQKTPLILPPLSAGDSSRWSAGMLRLGPCVAPDEPAYIYGARLTAENYVVLDFVHFNQPEQVTGFNIYRSSDAGLAPELWPLVADDIVDGFTSVPDVQWVDTSGDISPTGVWYYEVAPYNNGCDAEGPR